MVVLVLLGAAERAVCQLPIEGVWKDGIRN
jgi:hypothetical protein